MAIDSRQKRTSAVNLYKLIMPVADGTINQADREHITGLYMGITAQTPLSRQDRTSVANYHNLVMPVADGTISQTDRAHSAGMYTGIAAQSPVGGGCPIFSIEGIHSTIFGGMVVH